MKTVQVPTYDGWVIILIAEIIAIEYANTDKMVTIYLINGKVFYTKMSPEIIELVNKEMNTSEGRY